MENTMKTCTAFVAEEIAELPICFNINPYLALILLNYALLIDWESCL